MRLFIELPTEVKIVDVDNVPRVGDIIALEEEWVVYQVIWHVFPPQSVKLLVKKRNV